MESTNLDAMAAEAATDGRLYRVIRRLTEQCLETVQAEQLVAACLAEDDPQFCSLLQVALQAGQELVPARRVAIDCLLKQNPTRPLVTSMTFDLALSAEEAIQEWRERRSLDPAADSACGLELFLYCALKRLAPRSVSAIRNEFDVERLIAVLARKVVSVRSRSGSQKPAKYAGADTQKQIPELLVDGAVDLTAAACAGSLPCLADAAPWLEVLMECGRALQRRHIRHVLLVGERGVGKVELVIELARLLHEGAWPRLKDARVWLADRRFVDADESREHLSALADRLRLGPDQIVAVEGLAGLLRGQDGRSHKLLLYRMLRDAAGRMVALLTPGEYEDHFATDPTTSDFFERIDVPEPRPEQAIALVRRYAAGLGAQCGVHIPESASAIAVRLASDYVLHDHLPAKAVKLLQAACDEVALADQDSGSQPLHLTEETVIQVAARKTGVPTETLRGIAEQADYAEVLRQRVFGQDAAISEVALELGLIKGGMSDPGKPASVMLFLGQTGTGKTELAKALAGLYAPSRRLRVYTLGNCVEPHSVSTLIGVPPGYVGHDQGGRLVNDLNAEPYSVFLLDEADKAHPDVLQPFLNLFDEGWVTDQRGARGYADRAIFILTSNVGQRMLGDLVREGKPWEEITERMREAVTQLRHSKSNRPVFSAEFLARVKRFIVFRPLERGAFESIATKAITDLCTTWWSKRGKRLEVDPAIVERLARSAADRNEKSAQRDGGRLVRKLLADWVEAPLQSAIAAAPEHYRGASVVRLLAEEVHDSEASAPVVVVDWDAAPR